MKAITAFSWETRTKNTGRQLPTSVQEETTKNKKIKKVNLFVTNFP